MQGMGTLSVFIHHAQKVMEAVALADDMNELLEDRFDDMEDENEEQAERVRYMFYHTIDATKAILSTIGTQNVLVKYWDVPSQRNMEKIQQFCDQLKVDDSSRYKTLNDFATGQYDFILYSICSGMSYGNDRFEKMRRKLVL